MTGAAAATKIHTSLTSGGVLGYAESSFYVAESLADGGDGTLLGVSVDSTSIIVRFTVPADVNLDGAVDSIDFKEYWLVILEVPGTNGKMQTSISMAA